MLILNKSKTIILKLPNKILTYQKKELKLFLETEADQSVFNEIFQEKEYSFIEDILSKSQDLIIDIGAHIGLFTIFARLNSNPKTPIISFEPDPRNYQIFKKHLKVNNVRNVTSKNLAISNQNGRISFYQNEDSHNSSIISSLKGEHNKIEVSTNTLEKFLQKFTKNQKTEIKKIDLIKIDVEGSEFKIISSLPPEIFKITKSFIIEYHEYQSDMKKNNLISVLQKNNHKCIVKPSSYDSRMGFIFTKNKRNI